MAVSVRIDGQNLAVRISGWDVLWSLRRGMTIPLAHVAGASVESGSRRPVWRVIGTRIPGVLRAGWFRSKGQNEFWLVHRRATALAIALRDERFARLVLQVDDPETVAAMINAATGAGGQRAA